MEDIRLRNVSANNAAFALDCAMAFSNDYPDRKIGVGNGVAYQADRNKFYVYRMKKSIVVVGQ